MSLFKRDSESGPGPSAADAVGLLEEQIRTRQDALDHNLTEYGEQLIHQVSESVDRITKSVEDSIERVTATFEGGVELVAGKLASGVGHVGQAIDHISEASQDAYHVVDATVRKRPLAVLAVAVGVGLIASKVLSARASSRSIAGSGSPV